VDWLYEKIKYVKVKIDLFCFFGYQRDMLS
jgi:hypothetical protein